MEIIKEVLKKYKNIALIGASKDLTKTSSVVMKYLQDYGFKVYPVNPSMKGESILGEKVFGNIKEIDGPIEIDSENPNPNILKKENGRKYFSIVDKKGKPSKIPEILKKKLEN